MISPVGVRRRLCVAVDVQSYGSGDDHAQLAAQHDLLELLDASAKAAGLRRVTWAKQPGGDAELAVLPAEESEVRVVDPFVRELDAALRRHNQGRTPEAKLRIRMSVHFGPLLPAANGYAGRAPIDVTRLLNSSQLRASLADSTTRDLALVLSNQVYADTVAPLHTTWRPDQFRRIRIRVKEYEDDAWLWVPDDHASPKPAPSEPSSAADGVARRPRQVVRTKIDNVTGQNIVFGIQNN